MNFEEMQSTMQFMLQNQAKHDVEIALHSERMNELQQNFRILTELLQNYDKRLDSTERSTESFREELRLQNENFYAHFRAQREDFYKDLKVQGRRFSAELKEQRQQFSADLKKQSQQFSADLKSQQKQFYARLEAQAKAADKRRRPI